MNTKTEDQQLSGADIMRKAFEDQGGTFEPEADVTADIDDTIVEQIREDEGIAADEQGGDEKQEKSAEEAEAKDKDADKASEFGSDWDEDDRAVLNAASPELRALIEKKATPAESASLGGEVSKLFEPYADAVKQSGMSVPQIVKGWIDLFQFSQRDPQGYARHMLTSLNIDPATLVEKKEEPAPARSESDAASDDDDDPFADPKVKELQKTVADLQKRLETAPKPQEQATDPKLAADQAVWADRIETFRTAKDAEGKPLRPHFDALKTEMMSVINSLRSTGQPIELGKVYDMAVKLNPEISALVEADKKKADEAETAKKKQADLAKAKRASSSVRSDDEATDRPPKLEDLPGKEIIRAAARAHHII